MEEAAVYIDPAIPKPSTVPLSHTAEYVKGGLGSLVGCFDCLGHFGPYPWHNKLKHDRLTELRAAAIEKHDKKEDGDVAFVRLLVDRVHTEFADAASRAAGVYSVEPIIPLSQCIPFGRKPA